MKKCQKEEEKKKRWKEKKAINKEDNGELWKCKEKRDVFVSS